MTKIADLLQWGPPKRLNTRLGVRVLRIASPTEEFRKLWRANKDALKAVGLGWETDRGAFTGNVAWWAPLSPEEIAEDERKEEMSRATASTVQVPAPAGLEYFPFQRAGVAFMLTHDNTLLGDEMGVGKTIQAIGLINADPSIKTVLVVCPASLKLNWRAELRKWLVRDMAVNIVNKDGLGADCPIQIINFDILGKHPDVVGRQYDLLLVDEAHYIKSDAAKRTRAVILIKARRKVLMTGTPILNRPVELLPLLGVLNPRAYGDDRAKWKFKFRYCGAKKSKWGWDFSGASHLAELQKTLRQSLMIRRLKKDVLTELPPKLRTIVELDVDDEAREIANRELEAYENWETAKETYELLIADAEAKGDEQAYKETVAKLKEGADVAFQCMSRIRHESARAKTPAIIEYCKQILESNDSKLVVFAWHKDVIERLRYALNENGYNPVTVIGGMGDIDKDRSVRTFQRQDNKCRVFLGNIQAAGFGLTLTASSHVVFAELDWTPSRVTQAEDRCHRIGAKDNVLVEHLVIDNSLDCKMAKLIIEKQSIMDKALDIPAERVAAPTTTVELVQELPTVSLYSSESVELTEGQLKALRYAMGLLAGVCDGAEARDDCGFNRLDSFYGKVLASQQRLTQRQGAVAYKFAVRYQRQLPEDILEEIGIKRNKSE